MATRYTPKIVTDGLVLCLDAGNIKSYPGTGTTWTDLSRNGNNGTLTNGPTFNSANGGSIVFDGTDDSVIIPNSSSLAITGDITIMSWLNVTNFNYQYRGIVAKTTSNLPASYDFYLDSGYPRLFRGDGAGNHYNLIGSTRSLTANTWQNVSVTMTSTTVIHYLNAASNGTGSLSTTIANDANASVYIGNRADGVTRMLGNIALTLIYNRGLTSSEVLQNYNATKSRFGL